MTRGPVPALWARRALGVTRLTFGTVALVAPALPIRRIEGTGQPPPAAVYAFRMFGIRTVLLGRELLVRHEYGATLRRALAQAPLIHAVDTATATALTVQGQVSRRTGLLLVAVSAVNTCLALVARSGGPGSPG